MAGSKNLFILCETLGLCLEYKTQDIGFVCDELLDCLQAPPQDVKYLENLAPQLVTTISASLPSLLEKEKIRDRPAAEVEKLFAVLRSLVTRLRQEFIQSQVTLFIHLVDVSLAQLENTENAEETKLAAANLLVSILHRSEQQGTRNVFDLMSTNRANLQGLFAQLSLSLLACVRKEKLKELRLAALGSLERLFEEISRRNGDLHLRILPGVSSNLTQVVLGDFKIPSQVRSEALRVWKICLVSALSSLLPDSSSCCAKKDCPASTPQEAFLRRIGVERKETVGSDHTLVRVLQILDKLYGSPSLMGAENYRVHLELIDLAFDLLHQVARSLSSSSLAGSLYSLLVSHLVGYTLDPRQVVQSHAEKKLALLEESLQHGPDNVWNCAILPAVERSLKKQLLALSGHAKNLNEGAFRHQVRSCTGMVRLLGKRSRILFDSSPLLGSFVATFTDLLSFAASGSSLRADDLSGVSLHAVAGLLASFPRHHFEYLREDESLSVVKDLLSSIGTACGRQLVASSLLSLVANSFAESTEPHSDEYGEPLPNETRVVPESKLAEFMFFVMNTLLGTVEGPQNLENDEDGLHDARLAATASFDVFLALNLHRISSLGIREKCEAIRLEAIAKCFVLFSANRGGSRPTRWLVRCLFPVLEQVGSYETRHMVRQAALGALQVIACVCGYETTNSLLCGNLDYVLEALVHRLESLSMYPHTPAVLRATFELASGHSTASLKEIETSGVLSAGMDLEPFLHDLTAAALNSLDQYGTRRDETFTIALLRAVGSSVQSFAGKECFHLHGSPSERHNEITAVQSFIEQVKSASAAVERLDSDGEERKEEEEEEEEEEEVPLVPSCEDPPFQVAHAKAILGRVMYFATRGSIFVRSLALETITRCILCLDEKELLPAIHQIWPTVTTCLALESHAALLTNAFNLVTCCIRSAGSFMERRFAESVWPLMQRKLEKESNNLIGGRFHKELVIQMFACMVAALECFRHGVFQRKQMQSVAQGASIFLRATCDYDLRESARGIWLALAQTRREIVWLPVLSAFVATRRKDVEARCAVIGVEASAIPPPAWVSPTLPHDIPMEDLELLLNRISENRVLVD